MAASSCWRVRVACRLPFAPIIFAVTAEAAKERATALAEGMGLAPVVHARAVQVCLPGRHGSDLVRHLSPVGLGQRRFTG